MNSKTKFVQLYDFATEAVTTIPADELAPGMIAISIQGREGTYWVAPETLATVQGGVICHPPFTGENRKAIMELQEKMREVAPMTYDEWELGFRKDLHAVGQIFQWLDLADIYDKTSKQHSLSLLQRKALFGVLMTCMTSASHEMVWHVMDNHGLPEPIVREAVEEFFHHPTLKAEFAKLNHENYVDEEGHVPVMVTALGDPEIREHLAKMDLIFGIDCTTRNQCIFFGHDALRRIVVTEQSARLNVMHVLYDSRTDQLEYLVCVVMKIKGSCCYGQS